MLGPGLDLILFVGVTLLTIIPWVVSDVLGRPGREVLVGVAVVNGPHLISTWTRVYLSSAERFRRPVRYWVIPGLAFALAIVCDLRGGEWLRAIRSTIFYWATWHFVAQSWGVLRIYQRKHGAADRAEAKLEKADPLWHRALLRRCDGCTPAHTRCSGSRSLPPPGGRAGERLGAALVAVVGVYVASGSPGSGRTPRTSTSGPSTSPSTSSASRCRSW